LAARKAVNSVGNLVENLVGNLVENSVVISVGNLVENLVGNLVESLVENSVGISVENSVENLVESLVENSVERMVTWWGVRMAGDSAPLSADDLVGHWAAKKVALLTSGKQYDHYDSIYYYNCFGLTPNNKGFSVKWLIQGKVIDIEQTVLHNTSTCSEKAFE
jgi:hypothetical protein